MTSEIREFFAGRSVFTTGGTGFIGAVVLEKLLRACLEVATVYLLIRPKRLADGHDRVGALFDSRVSGVLIRQNVFTQCLTFPARKLELKKTKFSVCLRTTA
jgi:thioester reductase-like protein